MLWSNNAVVNKFVQLNSYTMNTITQPLTEAQLELLRLFNRDVEDADWVEIRRMITQYFANKASQAADKLWDEQGWSDQTMSDWLNTHQRTPYQQQ